MSSPPGDRQPTSTRPPERTASRSGRPTRQAGGPAAVVLGGLPPGKSAFSQGGPRVSPVTISAKCAETRCIAPNTLILDGDNNSHTRCPDESGPRSADSSSRSSSATPSGHSRGSLADPEATARVPRRPLRGAAQAALRVQP